jgi:hypothetical protein
MHESNSLGQCFHSVSRAAALALLLGLCSCLSAGNEAEVPAVPERLYFTIVSTITDHDRGDVHEHSFAVGTTEGEPARISTTLGDQGTLDYIVSYELPEASAQVLLSMELVRNGETVAEPKLQFGIETQNSASIRVDRHNGLGFEIDVEASRLQPNPL